MTPSAAAGEPGPTREGGDDEEPAIHAPGHTGHDFGICSFNLRVLPFYTSPSLSLSLSLSLSRSISLSLALSIALSRSLSLSLALSRLLSTYPLM